MWEAILRQYKRREGIGTMATGCVFGGGVRSVQDGVGETNRRSIQTCAGKAGNAGDEEVRHFQFSRIGGISSIFVVAHGIVMTLVDSAHQSPRLFIRSRCRDHPFGRLCLTPIPCRSFDCDHQVAHHIHAVW
jgi:hypothetical protein